MCIKSCFTNRRFDLVDEKYGGWVEFSPASNEEHSFAPLRQEGQRIYGPISPSVTSLFECSRETIHRCPLAELQHERHVFEHHDRHAPLIEETENMSDETGTASVDPGGHPGLG
jgi:hypothetical protein